MFDVVIFLARLHRIGFHTFSPFPSAGRSCIAEFPFLSLAAPGHCKFDNFNDTPSSFAVLNYLNMFLKFRNIFLYTNYM